MMMIPNRMHQNNHTNYMFSNGALMIGRNFKPKCKAHPREFIPVCRLLVVSSPVLSGLNSGEKYQRS